MWLIIVIIANLLNAVVFLIDKFLLTKSKASNPAVYTFFIGALGLVALILWPFGSLKVGWSELWPNIFSAVTFIIALWCFFTALKYGETSRVVPLVGGLQPLLIWVLAKFLLDEKLSSMQLWAFVLLVIGSVIISWEEKKKKKLLKRNQSNVWLIESLFSAFFFAVSMVSLKFVYLHQAFITGFVWNRIAGFVFVMLFLLHGPTRRAIFEVIHPTSWIDKLKTKISFEKKHTTAGLFLFNQGLGAIGFILLNYAVSLASVTLVQALQGVQYAFLFVIIILLTKFRPKLIKEKLNWQIVAQKVGAIILISIGLFLLS